MAEAPAADSGGATPRSSGHGLQPLQIGLEFRHGAPRQGFQQRQGPWWKGADHPVEHPASLAPRGDDASILEHAKMARNLGLDIVECAGQFANAQLALAHQKRKNAAASRIGESIEKQSCIHYY